MATALPSEDIWEFGFKNHKSCETLVQDLSQHSLILSDLDKAKHQEYNDKRLCQAAVA